MLLFFTTPFAFYITFSTCYIFVFYTSLFLFAVRHLLMKNLYNAFHTAVFLQVLNVLLFLTQTTHSTLHQRCYKVSEPLDRTFLSFESRKLLFHWTVPSFLHLYYSIVFFTFQYVILYIIHNNFLCKR